MTWLLPSLVLVATFADWSIADRARAADRVVVATVLESRVDVPGGDVSRMTTLTRVRVLRSLKGGAGTTPLEVLQLGGRHGEAERRIPGDATFVRGERAVLFLRCRDPARPGRCTLVGLSRGKLALAGEGKAQTVAVPVGAKQEQWTLQRVEAEVRAGQTPKGKR